MTWPLVTSPTGLALDLGDNLEAGRVLLHNTDWFLGRVPSLADIPFFFPSRGTLFWAENLLGQSALVLPFRILTDDGNALHNAALFLTVFLNGFGMFLLVRRLASSFGAALFAGVAFALFPYFHTKLSHIHILSAQWLLFFAWALHRWYERRHWVDIGWAALFLALSAYSTLYLTVMASPMIAVALAAVLYRSGLDRKRSLVQLGVMGILALGAAAPLFVTILSVHSKLGLQRSVTESIFFSARLESFWAIDATSLLYGGNLSRYLSPEAAHFFGILVPYLCAVALVRLPVPNAALRMRGEQVLQWARLISAPLLLIAATALLLAIFGLAIAKRPFALVLASTVLLIVLLWREPLRAFRRWLGDRFENPRRVGVAFALIGVTAAAFSLGPVIRWGDVTLGEGPYALLHRFWPGFSGLRVPARFMAIAAIGFTVLAALGLSKLIELRTSRRWRVGLAGVATGLVFLEFLHIHPWKPLPDTFLGTPLDETIAKLPDDRPALMLPMRLPHGEIHAMYRQRLWNRPVVNGYAGFFPPHHQAILRAADPDGGALDDYLEVLRAFGVGWLIVDDQAGIVSRRSWKDAVLHARVGGASVFRLSTLSPATEPARVSLHIARLQPLGSEITGWVTVANASDRPIADRTGKTIRIQVRGQTDRGPVKGTQVITLEPFWLRARSEEAHRFAVSIPREVARATLQVDLEVDGNPILAAAEHVELSSAIREAEPEHLASLGGQARIVERFPPTPAGRAACGRVLVENVGTVVFRRQAKHPVRLAYDVPARNEKAAKLAGRALLTHDVHPGESTIVRVCVTAPERPGTHRIEMQLVADGLTFFKERGAAPVFAALEVLPRPRQAE